MGREVETILNKPLGQGDHTVFWNAARFSSGAYFYRLQVGDPSGSTRSVDPSTGSGQWFIETKKLM
jgi:hypothetical protein